MLGGIAQQTLIILFIANKIIFYIFGLNFSFFPLKLSQQWKSKTKTRHKLAYEMRTNDDIVLSSSA